MSIKTALEILLPESFKEVILFAWDIIGMVVWGMITQGTLHNVDIVLEFYIKLATALGLTITVILKLMKLKKG